MPAYEYGRLEHTDSIRLIELYPAVDTKSPIGCNIIHVQLADSPSYEAISYTWGDDTAVHPIYTDSGTSFLEVRTNCYNILHQFRLSDRVCFLWIDAICINQSDLDERGHQVRMMDVIYEHATQVVVHLGEHADGSEALFDELINVNESLTIRTWHGRPSPSKFLVRALDNLLQRPWFRRVWILQEVSINPTIFFMCGSARASKEALVKCLDGFWGRDVMNQIAFPEACDKLLVRTRSARLSLWLLLVRSAKFLATDPRDKVFALRSLIGFEEQRTEMDPLIDYNQSVVQTFINTTIFLLPAVGLRLLGALRHPHDMDMPSWVPDFSQKLPLQDLCWPMGLYSSKDIATMLKKNSGRGARFEVVHQLGMLLLKARGIQLAKIRYRSPVFSFKNDEDAKSQLQALYNSLSNMVAWHSETTPLKDDCDFFTPDSDLPSAMSLLDPYTLKAGLHRIYSSGEGQSFHDSMQGCRIVLLDNDNLAIAPGAARDGDVVCLLQRGQSPCILRPCQNSYWRLISGNCHVFGTVNLIQFRAGVLSPEELTPVFPYAAYCEERKEAMETFTIC